MTTIKLDEGQIAIIWSVKDVMQECDWLTEEQALEVLHNIDHNHDATIGINWDVIYYNAEWMFPKGEEQSNG
jgi:hypothetical protein